MLSRFWQWLSRLWRRPEPEPLPPDLEVSWLLDESRQVLRDWAANKMRNDILAALNDEFPIPPPRKPGGQ